MAGEIELEIQIHKTKTNTFTEQKSHFCLQNIVCEQKEQKISAGAVNI